jgi:prophage antirepressor-like protein
MSNLPHIFDYHGTRVRVEIINGEVCVNSQDTLHCLGVKNAYQLNDPREMQMKLITFYKTKRGLAFCKWLRSVVFPEMGR